MKCDKLIDYDIMDIEAMDDERLEKSESGKIQVTRVYIKSEVDTVIAELKAKADKLHSCLKCLVMRDLIKDCPEKKSAIEIEKEYK